ncbi:MAG: DUF4153 domain-containing protein [Chitinophagaceae bacterium]
MKISFNNLRNGLQQSLTRFPFQVLVAALATAVGCAVVYRNFFVNEDTAFRILEICNLVFVFSLAADLFLEKRQVSRPVRMGAAVSYVLLGILLYYTLDFRLYEVNIFRFFALSAAFHLMVSFGPFLSKGNYQGFWQYNKALFLRILTAALYSGVLYAGLALAVWSVGELWNLHANEKIYAYLFVFISVFFNSVFFLAGIPKDFAALEKDDSYPKGLKIFAQYILIPLMAVYLVILFLYEIKILFQHTLPNGIVSWLIMDYAVFGILSLLLVYPVRDKEGNKWIRTFGKVFYIMLFPLLVLLFVAIGIRVSDYGVTEDRYAIVVVGIWLLLVAVYSLWRPSSIKFIPVTLCAFCLLAVYGPQSAPYIARHSQVAQLNEILSGKKKDSTGRANDLLSHIVRQYGMEALQPLTNVPLAPIENSIVSKNKDYYDTRWKMKDTMRAILKIQASYGSAATNSVKTFSVSVANEYLISVKSYDYIIEGNHTSFSFVLGNVSYTFDDSDQKAMALRDSMGNQIVFRGDSLVGSIRQLAENHQLEKISERVYQVPDSLLEISKPMNGYTFTLRIPRIENVDWQKEDYGYYYFYGTMLLVRKRNE